MSFTFCEEFKCQKVQNISERATKASTRHVFLIMCAHSMWFRAQTIKAHPHAANFWQKKATVAVRRRPPRSRLPKRQNRRTHAGNSDLSGLDCLLLPVEIMVAAWRWPPVFHCMCVQHDEGTSPCRRLLPKLRQESSLHVGRPLLVCRDTLNYDLTKLVYI